MYAPIDANGRKMMRHKWVMLKLYNNLKHVEKIQCFEWMNFNDKTIFAMTNNEFVTSIIRNYVLSFPTSFLHPTIQLRQFMFNMIFIVATKKWNKFFVY